MKQTEDQKEIRRLKKHLQDLTDSVLLYIAAVDAEVGPDETILSGQSKRLAQLTNALEIQNDRARYFGLNVDHRKDDKGKVIKKLLKRK